MLDGISFEEMGKPAVVVATTNFVRLATSIKQSMNLAGLPLVVVPHPLGNQVVEFPFSLPPSEGDLILRNRPEQ